MKVGNFLREEGRNVRIPTVERSVLSSSLMLSEAVGV